MLTVLQVERLREITTLQSARSLAALGTGKRGGSLPPAAATFGRAESTRFHRWIRRHELVARVLTCCKVPAGWLAGWLHPRWPASPRWLHQDEEEVKLLLLLPISIPRWSPWLRPALLPWFLTRHLTSCLFFPFSLSAWIFLPFRRLLCLSPPPPPPFPPPPILLRPSAFSVLPL